MGYAFISYSSKQQRDADALRLLLHSNDIDTWMAPYDIPDGTEYADVINNAIQNAACFVLLLTEDAQNSIYVDKEIERALHYGKTIAPIQLGAMELNDSFSFYLCNQQIVTVPTIDASAPKIQSLLQHLQYLCNDRLPEKEGSLDAARDKRVLRQRISRLFCRGGIVLLCASLFCGRQYIDMSFTIAHGDLYGAPPTLPEILRSYLLFFSMALVAVPAYLYGCGLRDPNKKSWNPIQVLSRHKILPAFSVLCGAGFAMVFFAQQTVEKITRGAYYERYILPPWITVMKWIFAAGCIAAALLSFVFAFIRGKRNGFAFARSLRSKFLMTVTHWKRGDK